MRYAGIATLSLLAVAAPAPAQDRFTVGQKLIQFEVAWDAHPDAAARKRTLPPLKRALGHFFSGKFADAGRSLDEARHALEGEAPASDAVRWVESLAVLAPIRLVEPGPIDAHIVRVYDPRVARPARVDVQLWLDGEDGGSREIMTTEVAGVPKVLMFPGGKLPDGDHTLRSVFNVEGKEAARSMQTISVVRNARARWERLRPIATEQLRREPRTVETLTLAAHVQRLGRMLDGISFETNVPAARLLREAEDLAKLPEAQTYFDGQRSGQFWLTLPGRNGQSVPIRIDVPPQAKQGNPLPLVVALHGMGGSENLFFDAYGHGEIVRQARRRGWILVATRMEGFVGAPPVADILDQLMKRYPVDKSRVFLVGHSMGAAQSVSLAKSHPDRWAGVACLGGGAGVVVTEPMKNVPFYVGVGTEDFLIAGCRGLVKALKDAGVTTVQSHEFPDIEHIMIVPAALPEVFEWFEKLPGR